jgi:hypothetical protein
MKYDSNTLLRLKAKSYQDFFFCTPDFDNSFDNSVITRNRCCGRKSEFYRDCVDNLSDNSSDKLSTYPPFRGVS